MKVKILFVLVIASITMYGQSDFTGKWKLNTHKSEFNDTPGAPAAASLLVQQKAGTITFQRDERRIEFLKVDSAAFVDIEEGDHTTRVSMKLSGDKKGFVETRVYTYPKTETGIVAAKKIRTWTLSGDKKVLTITDQIMANNGDYYVMVLVYEKQ